MDAKIIEQTVVNFFNYRQNIIVPNVFWGWGLSHEADLIVLRPSGYAVEVEIKVSLADIKKDNQKRRDHWENNKISRVFFAIPSKLKEKALEIIPTRYGIICVYEKEYNGKLFYEARTERNAKLNKFSRKINDIEKLKLTELGVMRIWSLKDHIHKLKTKTKR